MKILILVGLYLFPLLASCALLKIARNEKGRIVRQISTNDKEAGIFCPGLNWMFAIYLLIFVVIEIAQKLTNKFSSLLIKKKNGKFLSCLKEIEQLATEEYAKGNLSENGMVSLLEIKESIKKGNEKYARYRNEKDFKKIEIQYEDPAKNSLQSLKNSLKYKGEIDEELAEEIAAMCRSFESTVDYWERKIFEKNIDSVKFENEYLKMIKNQETN